MVSEVNVKVTEVKFEVTEDEVRFKWIEFKVRLGLIVGLAFFSFRNKQGNGKCHK